MRRLIPRRTRIRIRQGRIAGGRIGRVVAIRTRRIRVRHTTTGSPGTGHAGRGDLGLGLGPMTLEMQAHRGKIELAIKLAIMSAVGFTIECTVKFVP